MPNSSTPTASRNAAVLSTAIAHTWVVPSAWRDIAAGSRHDAVRAERNPGAELKTRLRLGIPPGEGQPHGNRACRVCPRMGITAAVDGAGDRVVGDDTGDATVGTVAVVAHRKKSLDGGLDELRSRLADLHVEDVLWYEVNKSKKAPRRVRQAMKAGADLILAWGGDGMVEHCLDTLAGSDVPVGSSPQAPRTCSRTTSASPRTSATRSTSH